MQKRYYKTISVSILGISIVSDVLAMSVIHKCIQYKHFLVQIMFTIILIYIYNAAASCIIELAKVSRTVLMSMYCDVDTEYVVMYCSHHIPMCMSNAWKNSHWNNSQQIVLVLLVE